METRILKISRARELRKNQTEAESSLWSKLRAHRLGGYHFRRQHPIGPYIVDFVCLEKGLIIEIDGDHHAYQAENDSVRTQSLESQGFRVLRFWNNQVIQEIDGVKAAILEVLEAPESDPRPSLPPRGGRNKSTLPLKGES